MGEFPGEKTASFLACLEALAVLRRTDTKENAKPTDDQRTFEIWGAIVKVASLNSISIHPVRIWEEFNDHQAHKILGMIAGSEIIPQKRKRDTWARGVGIMDCIHLEAGLELKATHFLTTDRCLAKMNCGMEMVLLESIEKAGLSMVRPSDMVRRAFPAAAAESF